MEDNNNQATTAGTEIPPGPVSPPRNPVQNATSRAANNPSRPQPAPAAPRNRRTRGSAPLTNRHSPSSAPALLEIAIPYPMYTDPRRTVNLFVPDAQMLYHVLGICDSMMISTDRFTRSTPSWLPIVSQLYTAVLWNVMILKVYVHTGYASSFSSLLDALTTHLHIEECMIPGPLVPYFQSLAAINGPFDWIGDISPALPGFDSLWDGDNFHPNPSLARQHPIPAIMLDQLHYFATYTPANVADYYTHFEWYRNVFSRGVGTTPALARIGPNLCGSLYAPRSQFEYARDYWNSALAVGITRTDAAAAPLTNYLQLLGLQSQTGIGQINWFQHVATAMFEYSRFFNGSTPLKDINVVGLGAVATYGTPLQNTATRNWLYPADADLAPFTATRTTPRREIPNELRIHFNHSDHELEQQAEQYAIIAHTNIRWYENIATQNERTAINRDHLYQGDYWDMMTLRHSFNVSLKPQYAQLIASRYHRLTPN